MRNNKLFYTNLVYFICACLIVTLYILNNVIDFSFMPDDVYDTLFSIVLQVGILFVLPISLYSAFTKQKLKTTFKQFRYNGISFASIVYCIIIGICCYLLNLAIASFFSGLIRLFGYESVPTYTPNTSSNSVEGLLLNLFLVAVLPAICEENIHRGMLLSGYSSLGLKRAVILSSLMFGLMHLNVNQFFYATILGFLMSISVVISKSIVPGMIIHFLNNALGIYLNYATQKNIFGGKILPALSNLLTGGGTITAFISSFLFLACLIGIMIFFYYLLLKETRVKKVKKLFEDVMKIDTTAKEREMIKSLDKNARPFTNTYIRNLETLNSMLMQYNVNSSKDLVFRAEENKYNKPTLSERILIIGTLILTVSITIFTFVWGLL